MDRAIDIRRFEAVDIEACYAISLATGLAGSDASHLYVEPQLMGTSTSRPMRSSSRTWCWSSKTATASEVRGRRDRCRGLGAKARAELVATAALSISRPFRYAAGDADRGPAAGLHGPPSGIDAD